MKRSSGILMPIFSLPNKYGIGSFGKEAYNFIDFLKNSGQSVWQILPLVQTGYGNSPYSSVCSESFNPYFISVDELKKQKLITKEEAESAEIEESGLIDYGKIYEIRYPLLKKAFYRFDKKSKEFKSFLKKGDYRDYAIYMAIKKSTDYLPLDMWEHGLRYREENAIKHFVALNEEEITFWQFVQYEAEREWFNLKKYAKENKIQIMGDMPLYVALDSVDVWVNPSMYKIEDFKPKKVAGVPPDYFCASGQLWGNPVYDYNEQEKDGFLWWKKRIVKALNIFDLVRIDHFRGLDRYYEVDAYRTDATVGEWIDVPSEKLFNAIHSVIKKDRIIAEDLGIIDDGVRELLKFTGYPGMKVLSFAFNGQSDNLYLPENIEENSVCYTGTHDNDTLIGLIANFSEWDYNNLITGVKNSLKLFGLKNKISDEKSLAKAIIELGFISKAKLFIMPMADVLLKGTEYRINEPGVVKEQNWSVRFNKSDFNSATEKRLFSLTKQYKR